MATTNLEIDGENFRINGDLIYSELPDCDPRHHGLLMNARFIQGVFDNRADPTRFARFGYDKWDAEENTNRLVEALPEWHSVGLRAVTVGFQGGGPFYTIPNHSIDNNPFGPKGDRIDDHYRNRMDRIIRGADAIGMVVIVSFLYQGQAHRLDTDEAIQNAVVSASRFLADGGYRNVIIEVANENDVGDFRERPIVASESGMCRLMEIAKRESGGMPVGCSGGGGSAYKSIVRRSDVILVHGNGQTRQNLATLVAKCRRWSPDVPIVCNEDSQALGQIAVASEDHFSWGYYNNMTKQEPPSNWSILPGEDSFFADRLCKMLEIDHDPPDERAFYLAGLEPDMSYGGRRWLRLAAPRPEIVDRVKFLRDGLSIFTCWDEPFSLYWKSNFDQAGVEDSVADGWEAKIFMRDGSTAIVTASPEKGQR